MQSRSDHPPPGQGRGLHVAGVTVILMLAGVLAALPVLLSHSPAPAPQPAAAPAAPRESQAHHDHGPEPERGDDAVPSPPSMPISRQHAHPADQPPAPITERRSVQMGPAPPRRVPPPETPAAERGEWDRSADARRQGVEQFGGTPLTENAVEAGLAWLAAHQSEDGSWSRFEFDRQCPPDDRCPGAANRRTEDDLRAGITGLAMLAFLGAGYTDRDGPYPEVVARAVNALLALQQPHGGFSADENMAGYNDSVATLALAEYYALTHDDRVAAPLERAVGRLVRSQQALGGWDYLPRRDTGRNDTSIAAWMVQALHACAAAGLEVPPETLIRAALHFVRATEPDGRVRYSDSGTGYKLDEGFRPVYRYGPGILAAGLMAEQLLGWRLEGAIPLRQRAMMLADPPSAGQARGGDPTRLHSEYYWYYGTLAMFQRGGDDWDRWNAALRDAILPLQNREKPGRDRKAHAYGSWRPYGTNWGLWGRMGGRVYTTAICTLTLEIYYRHTPAFLRDQLVYSAWDWREYASKADARERLLIVEALAQLRVEIGEPALVDLLADQNRDVALGAAVALAWVDSPLGISLIEEACETLPAWQRQSLENALQRARAVSQLPPVAGRVRLYDAETRLATVDLPRSHIGMTAVVSRDGRRIAELRVIQRFTARTIAVAELTGAALDLPASGDSVVAR